MAKNVLEINAGFLPYEDGSGYQVEVQIYREGALDDTYIAINTSYRFELSDWIKVRDGIEQLLRGVGFDSAPLPPQERKAGKVCCYHDGCPPEKVPCHLCAHLQTRGAE